MALPNVSTGVEELDKSNTENRITLQKSIRAGLGHVRMSINSMHDTLKKLLDVQKNVLNEMYLSQIEDAEEREEERRRQRAQAEISDEGGEEEKPSYFQKFIETIKKRFKLIVAGLLAGTAALLQTVEDSFKGANWAEELGLEKFSGFVGGFLGGSAEGSLLNMILNSFKFATLGVALGVPFGPIGMIAGGVIFGLLGAVLGAIGGEKIAEFIDPIVVSVKRFFGFSVNTTVEELEKSIDLINDMEDDLATRAEKIKDIKDNLAKAKSDEETLELQKQLLALQEEQKQAEKAILEAKSEYLQQERDISKNELNDVKELQASLIMQSNQNTQKMNNIKMQMAFMDKSSTEYEIAMTKLAILEGEQADLADRRKEVSDQVAEKTRQLTLKDIAIAESVEAQGGTLPFRTKMNLMVLDFNIWVSNTARKIGDLVYTQEIDEAGDPLGRPKIFGVEIPTFESLKQGFMQTVEDVGKYLDESWIYAQQWFNDKVKSIGDFVFKEVDGRFVIFGLTIPTVQDITDEVKKSYEGSLVEKIAKKIGNLLKDLENLIDSLIPSKEEFGNVLKSGLEEVGLEDTWFGRKLASFFEKKPDGEGEDVTEQLKDSKKQNSGGAGEGAGKLVLEGSRETRPPGALFGPTIDASNKSTTIATTNQGDNYFPQIKADKTPPHVYRQLTTKGIGVSDYF